MPKVTKVPKVLPADEQGAKSAAAEKVGFVMIVNGSWFMVHGSWFIVQGSWFKVHSPKGFPLRFKVNWLGLLAVPG